MTRIIAGLAGGRRLATPPGTGTRPTSDRTREALFASLGDLTGLTFLDLYAGSGGVGLEALSRGAGSAVLVENDPVALRVLRGNAAVLELPGSRVVGTSVERFLAGAATAFDVVFLDPPYSLDLTHVTTLLPPWVGDRLVIERATRSGEPRWPEGTALSRSRRYGETTLWYGAAL